MSLNGPNFSNAIDSVRWKELVSFKMVPTRSERRGLWITVCACPTALLGTTNPMSFPCSCHHLHTANPRGLSLPALQSPLHQRAETLTTHQSTWSSFSFFSLKKMVWLLYFFSEHFLHFYFFTSRNLNLGDVSPDRLSLNNSLRHYGGESPCMCCQKAAHKPAVVSAKSTVTLTQEALGWWKSLSFHWTSSTCQDLNHSG